MKISIAELESLVSIFSNDLKNNLGSDYKIELADDYYWSIDSEEKYNPAKEPKDLTLGQLYDDWTELISVIRKNRPCVSYDLVRFSSIIRYIGEKSVW